MTLKEFVLFCAVMIFSATMVQGCVKDREGPAERAGKRVDDVVDNAAESMEELGDDIEDSAEDNYRR